MAENGERGIHAEGESRTPVQSTFLIYVPFSQCLLCGSRWSLRIEVFSCCFQLPLVFALELPHVRFSVDSEATLIQSWLDMQRNPGV